VLRRRPNRAEPASYTADVKDGGPGTQPRAPRRHRRGWRIAGFAALGVIVVVGAAGWFVWDRYLRNDAKPVDVAEVEQRFSSAAAGGTARAGDPKPGVYLYRTVGSESVSALGGATNRYPRTTTSTVTDTRCGVDTRWDVLEGRYDGATRCRRPDGTWILTGTTTSDRFFNQTEADTYTCPDIVELPGSPKAGATWTGTCKDAPTSGPPNTTTYTYRVIGPATVQVAGEAVDTVRLRITAKQGGQRSGGGVEHRWVQPGTNLVVRSVGNETDESPSPVGSVTYKQQYDVRLRSLEPRT
jgi:hypothetical protein